MTALPWGRALLGWGGPHSPHPNPKHRCAQPQPSCSTILPGWLPKCPPYMYIYTTKPQNTRYIEIPTWGRPHTNSSRNPLQGWDVIVPPTHTCYHPPAPPWHAEAGAAQTRGPCREQLRHSQEEQGVQGWGGAEAAQGPPTSTDTGDQWGGTDRTNKQTNVRGTRQSKGDFRGPSSRPKPGPTPRGGWQGCWVRLGLAQMRRGGSLAPPRPSAQWQ